MLVKNELNLDDPMRTEKFYELIHNIYGLGAEYFMGISGQRNFTNLSNISNTVNIIQQIVLLIFEHFVLWSEKIYFTCRNTYSLYFV